MTADVPRLAHSIPDTMQVLDLSRQAIYNEINAGRLRTFRVGRRRLVSGDALKEWIKLKESENAGDVTA